MRNDRVVIILRFAVWAIAALLFSLPFTWLPPGEMDLGGDSSRLYFYQPLTFLRRFSLFSVTSSGLGSIEPNHYAIPFVVLFALVKTIVGSSYRLICAYNGVVLSVAFLSIYHIVLEMVRDRQKASGLAVYLSAISAGLLYIFMPTMTGNWDKAIFSHTQVFLNPLMFLLLLKFFTSNRKVYLIAALMLTVLFSINFGLTSAPPFFAFYPLAIVFLLIYVTRILNIKLHGKNIFAGILFALGLGAFHLIPQLVSLFDPGSFANTRVFDRYSIYHEGVQYFSSVLSYARVSAKVLLTPLNTDMTWTALAVPMTVILGIMCSPKKNTVIKLTGLFFLITLFLLTAKITNIGVEFYKQLFYLPGFSMFRNFIGQWLFVFSFFYAILFGQSLAVIFSGFKRIVFPAAITLGLTVVFVWSALPFVRGNMVREFHGLVENKQIPIRMDPKYEETLEYIRKLPEDGKIITLPFTDPYYQLLRGTNGGVYIGLSTISYLTDKKDFPGYAVMSAPISEEFLQMARANDYQGIRNLLRILNIRYIFHNDDPGIYDTDFPGWPYDHVRESLPKNQEGYKKFIQALGGRLVYTNGSYALYRTSDESYDPHIYVATRIVPYEAFETNGNLVTSFVGERNQGARTAFINKTPLNVGVIPNITFHRVNPAKYVISVEHAKGPYTLVFSDAFHAGWKLRVVHNTITLEDVPVISYFGTQVNELHHKDIFWDTSLFATFGKTSIPESQHFFANGYANAWYIRSEDVGGKESYVLILENTRQKIFYASAALSACTLIGFVVWSVRNSKAFS